MESPTASRHIHALSAEVGSEDAQTTREHRICGRFDIWSCEDLIAVASVPVQSYDVDVEGAESMSQCSVWNLVVIFTLNETVGVIIPRTHVTFQMPKCHSVFPESPKCV